MDRNYLANDASKAHERYDEFYLWEQRAPKNVVVVGSTHQALAEAGPAHEGGIDEAATRLQHASDLGTPRDRPAALGTPVRPEADDLALQRETVNQGD
jgi:hypothetical protein